jgi:hypothetical protein
MKTLAKTITVPLLLFFIIGIIGAIDTESYQFIDHLLSLSGPGRPELFEDGVIFTAPSTYERVGISFAHEGFSKVHWFKKLVFLPDVGSVEKTKQKNGPVYQDSGILFYVYTFPKDIRELEYRLIINGLWTTDPVNPVYRMDALGVSRSVVSIPVTEKIPSTFDGPPGTLIFNYTAPSGEAITVAGNFNGWDPFMYELQEKSPGHYSLTLSLPPGTYHYVFFHRGQRILDPNNHQRIYTKDGKPASLAVIQ